MPAPMLQAFASMMPRLEAIETLRMFRAMRLARPLHDKSEVEKVTKELRELEATARGGEPAPVRQADVRTLAWALGQAGVEIEAVPNG